MSELASEQNEQQQWITQFPATPCTLRQDRCKWYSVHTA
jgi:hypothetical protein